MKLIIEDDEGRRTVVPVVGDEITIGRGDENVIKLTERNVSRRHAQLKRENGTLLIEDLGSYNGVRINGKRISEATPITEGDLIEIGDYDLAVEGRFEVARPDDMPPPRATFPSPPAPPPEPANIRSATETIAANPGGMFMLSPGSGETRPAAPEIVSKPQESRQQAETKTRQRKLPLVVAAAGAGLAVGIAIASLLVTKASAHMRWEPPRSTAATGAPP